MQIAIGQPIGYQGGAASAAGVFDYLLSDTFTTDRAAGAVDGTPAEPGPGVRTVVDTGNFLSLSSGQAAIGGRINNGDPSVQYGAVGRANGLIIRSTALAVAGLIELGFDDDQSGAISIGLAIGSTIRARSPGLGVVIVWGGAFDTEYGMVVALRSAGAAYFIKFASNWILVWENANSSASPLWPSFGAVTASVGWFDEVRVPSARWLPVPLLSDGFSVLSTSDGLGHAEGVNGGLGSGGDGVTWTDDYGIWAVGGSGGASLLKAATLASGRAIRTAMVSTADVIASVKCTLAGGTMSIIVRWASEGDFVQLRLTSTNRQLVKVVSGVATTVSDTAYTYVAGAELRLICQGSAFRTFYNGAAIGGEFTISDAILQSSVEVGLRTDNVDNQFDDFVVYSRGTDGIYDNVLDAI